MSNQFHIFAKLVHDKFVAMSKHELFNVNIDRDELYAAYQDAFPAGTNEIFRTNREHECSTCRSFIKNIGNVVILKDGIMETVWDVKGAPAPYNEVARLMDELICSRPVHELFRADQRMYGAQTSNELMGDTVHVWHHFHGRLADKHFTDSPGAAIGAYAARVQVFERGLKELTNDALLTVRELVQNNALYRGQEHLIALKAFWADKQQYDKLAAPGDKNNFVWANADDHHAIIRNTAIGTLLIDLSGMPAYPAKGDEPAREAVPPKELVAAVKSYEDKVSGTNYKRPTALVTQAMVDQAMKTINELGIEPSLQRRMAKLSDISVNNVLWVDNTARKQMKGGLAGLLESAVTAPVTAVKGAAEDIGLDKFLRDVLPNITSMGVFVKNSMLGNFVTLTAPVHADTASLFKWNNDFAWSYDGNVADSIKERVKAAGGTVVGDLCCRLAWEYTDDLDLHMKEPGGGHLYFCTRKTANGGQLDVDANGGNGMMDHPVENIFYADRRKMKDGVYTLQVNNYNRRSTGVGFEVEIEFDGRGISIVYDKALRSRDTITVARIKKTGDKFEIIESLPASQGAGKSQTKWGVATETFTKVNTLTMSPNYWDDNAVGNKHFFFMLDGCANPEPTRGIYNEFLSSALDKHRKVFELLGDKTKCQPTDDQLSGVGFSSTKGDTVMVNVTGPKIRKTYNIIF